jgi:hypothetical protein
MQCVLHRGAISNLGRVCATGHTLDLIAYECLDLIVRAMNVRRASGLRVCVSMRVCASEWAPGLITYDMEQLRLRETGLLLRPR